MESTEQDVKLIEKENSTEYIPINLRFCKEIKDLAQEQKKQLAQEKYDKIVKENNTSCETFSSEEMEQMDEIAIGFDFFEE